MKRKAVARPKSAEMKGWESDKKKK